MARTSPLAHSPARALVAMLALVWRASPFGIAGVCLSDLVQGVAPAASAWIIKLLVDTLATHLQNASPFGPELIRLLAAQVGVTLLLTLAQHLGQYARAEVTRRLALDVQRRVYGKVSALEGLAPFEDPRFHNTLELGAQAAQSGPLQTVGALSQALQSGLTLVTLLGVLVVFSPLLAAAVVLASLPLLVAHLKLGRERFDLAAHNSPKNRLSAYCAYVLSSVHFAKELRLFRLGPYFLDSFTRATEEVHGGQRRQQLREVRWQVALQGLSSLVAGAGLIFVVLRAAGGRLSLGDVVLYVTALTSVQTALAGLMRTVGMLNESVLSYARFAGLMELPQPIAITASPRAVPPLRVGLELRRAGFRYGEHHPWVLRGVDLVIPAGRCTALVGLNGAGKTTIVKLLTRLYDPTEGQVLWDGIDLREFDPQALRERVAATFQDFARYDISARDNVGLGDLRHLRDLARVREAAARAGVDETLAGLPQGYDTVLSRWLSEDGRGADLSLGEWQKVALARMFMRPADLLILDEPTASLDAEAEYQVYASLLELVQGSTSVLISHRFSTVRMAHTIAVLEGGVIAELGTHDDLYAEAGSYKRLYERQAERYR